MRDGVIQSPNGAKWSVVSESDGVVTLELQRLPDGAVSQLMNRQQFSLAELRAGSGWRGEAEEFDF